MTAGKLSDNNHVLKISPDLLSQLNLVSSVNIAAGVTGTVMDC